MTQILCLEYYIIIEINQTLMIRIKIKHGISINNIIMNVSSDKYCIIIQVVWLHIWNSYEYQSKLNSSLLTLTSPYWFWFWYWYSPSSWPQYMWYQSIWLTLVTLSVSNWYSISGNVSFIQHQQPFIL